VSDLLNIEVAYALPERQTVLCIRVAPETSVLAAIEQSGILQKHPEIDLSVNKFGIYSRPVKGTESVQEGIASRSTALSSPTPRRCARSGRKKPRKRGVPMWSPAGARCAPQARRCRHLTGDGL
jgi:putative ubiquitin-RnfH superfamily antitoxin RatB of RatAB toxin-antitoxin module